MKVEDTVMNQEQRDEVYNTGDFKTVGDERIAFCKAQAEITAPIFFKAGQEEEAKGGHNSISYLEGVEEGEQRGIRKVVEFIHEEFGGYTRAIADGGELINIIIDNNYGEDGSLERWQAKLKEWSIE